MRPRPDGEGYEIVAGERRWRAAQMAQVHDLPVVVRDFSDSEVLEVAIIENIQRADLNPIEEALAFRQLMDRFGHTQEKLAEALSKSRSHIANLLRLLQLPEEVQAHLREGRLTAGHARALITTPNPSELARQVIAKGMSVREAERLAKTPKARPNAGPGHRADGFRTRTPTPGPLRAIFRRTSGWRCRSITSPEVRPASCPSGTPRWMTSICSAVPCRNFRGTGRSEDYRGSRAVEGYARRSTPMIPVGHETRLDAHGLAIR